MDVDLITALISNIGFPIVITLILIYIIMKMAEESKLSDERWQNLLSRSSKGWQEAINNNTKVMQSVLDELKQVSQTNIELQETNKQIQTQIKKNNEG